MRGDKDNRYFPSILDKAAVEFHAVHPRHTRITYQTVGIEQAFPILWLASDEASYVTGANFAIDGGISGLRD